MELRFLGAAGTVTGSRTLVTAGDTRLLVDCGMFQGFKENRLRNRDRLDVGPLDGVALTHAHIDHSGWVPALVRQGYTGPVYCTPGTASLVEILWPDSGRLQEEDAAYANRKRSSRHEPALPLYTEQDALNALERLVPVPFGEAWRIGELQAEYRVAGHILGAASLELRAGSHSVLFSGDLGRPDDAVVPAPVPPPAVDVLVLESTYGGRSHPEVDRDERLAEVITRTAERGGMVLIPSFAVGRAQALLWALHRLVRDGRIPRLPVVVDSPMATRATRAFLGHAGSLRLTPSELRAMTERVEFVGTVEASKALNARTEPFVLLSASGMLTGGRVLHHLVARGRTARNTLLFVGFQAPGTRGGRIVDGERTIRVFGEKIPIRCEVEEIGGYSAHADADELIAWVESAARPPGRILLNHGEPAACDALRLRLQDQGRDVAVATEGVVWDVADRARRPTPIASVPTPPRASLLFRDDGEGVVAAIQTALAAMDAGQLPHMPVVVQGVGLARRVRADLPADLLARVQVEG